MLIGAKKKKKKEKKRKRKKDIDTNSYIGFVNIL